MATRIRFARGGSKKRPFYRLVVADKRAPRDGSFIEKIGLYNPLLDDNNKDRFTFNKERVEYWLKTGATPSEKVAIFLYNNGFKTVENYLPTQYPKTAKEREALKKKQLADKAKEEAKKAEEKETPVATDTEEAPAVAEKEPAQTTDNAKDQPAEDKTEAKENKEVKPATENSAKTEDKSETKEAS